MGERRKRQRVSDNGDAIVPADLEAEPERVRKTNDASARRSLFVRSLPTTVTNEDLTELFSQDYPIKHVTIVTDNATKQSKGFGFVTFADAEDAQRAKEEFNGHVLQGRKIKVEIAEPRHRDPDNAASEDAKQAAAAKKEREEKLADAKKPPKLIVRNLPWSIAEPEQLAVYFRKFGLVRHVVIPKKNKGLQSGFAFVTMRGKKNAQKALEAVNGIEVDGRTLAVDWAVDKEVWEGQKQTEEATEPTDTEAKNKVDISEDENDDVMNFMKAHQDDLEEEDYSDDDEGADLGDEDDEMDGVDDEELDEDEENSDMEGSSESELGEAEPEVKPKRPTDNATVLFIRNLPYTTKDEDLKEHFQQFGAVRYARIVMDREMDRPKGTGFVCFYNVEDAETCFEGAPKQSVGLNGSKGRDTAKLVKKSLLEDENADSEGTYTIEGRVLQVSRAVNREEANVLTEKGHAYRENRDRDKRRLYLLSEGTVPHDSPLFKLLPDTEIKMREESATQRKKLIQNNPSLHISLTRVAIRNLPRTVTSKDLKALARQAVVEFAKEVKAGKRAPLSREEETRGGVEQWQAEKLRREKGRGIVSQAKVVFEDRTGSKVTESGGAGRSRGYGFIEYSSHRWALKGLRWLNGHPIANGTGRKQRLIAEFAIENAQVVLRRKEKEEKDRAKAKEEQEADDNSEASPDKKGGKSFKGKKDKRDKKQDGAAENGTKRKREDSTTNEADESEKLKRAKRTQIIARKRILRRNRKKGGAHE